MTDLKFKPGDHVMVPMKVTGVAPGSHWPYSVLLRDYEKDFGFWVPAAALASATLIERALVVGDRVEWPASDWMPGTGRILDISADHAILRRLSGDGQTWPEIPLSELRRAEERG